MARTSKKADREFNIKKRTAADIVWKAGIYARLSVDGNEKKNESIDTQIEIAKEHLRRIEDTELADCYIDLGKTGTNFEREGFARMMEDIREKKINCVVVKDFSRFGRNYIETGNYIEKIFPFLNVRFIAVTDGYDSEQMMGDNDQLSMNLKNIVNELYARDISQKGRAVKKMEQEKGSYTGGVPPYGYHVKKVDGKKVLFPDTAARHIVVKIFEMYAEGKSRREIAEELYREKVQRPLAYYTTGEVYGSEGGPLQQWSYDTIKNILMNPVYIGTLFQARGCGKPCQNRGRYEFDEESDISVVEHTHEPLVSEELFYQVSKRFQEQSKYANRDGFSKKIPQKEDIFKGIVYCGECGRCMIRNPSIKALASGERVRRYYYACPNRDKIDKSACSCPGISWNKLESLVKAALEKEFACSKIYRKDYCEENRKEAAKKKAVIHKSSCESKRKQEELSRMGSELYLRYREGELPCEAFLEEKSKIQKEIEELKRQAADFEQQEAMVEKEVEKKNQFFRGLLKWKTDVKLDRELMACLIKEINVYPMHRVEIIFNYRKDNFL